MKIVFNTSRYCFVMEMLSRGNVGKCYEELGPTISVSTGEAYIVPRRGAGHKADLVVCETRVDTGLFMRS